MALTIALVYAAKNRLRYLCTTDVAATTSITTTGATTPDIQTDLTGVASILKAIAQVITAGYGKLASGTQTQAKARALWASDDAVSVVGANVPTALLVITPRSGVQEWSVDANVSGANPIISVTTAAAAAGTAYLDIFIPGAIGA